MMKTFDHGHFEILCALGASGQLTRQEFDELREHSRFCASCSRRLVEMTQLGADIFFSDASRAAKVRTPAGMRKRFVERAMNEGIPLNGRANWHSLNTLGLSVVMTLVFVLVAVKPGIELFSQYFGKAKSIEIASTSGTQLTASLIQESATNSQPKTEAVSQNSDRRVVLPNHRKALSPNSYSHSRKQRSTDNAAVVLLQSQSTFVLHIPQLRAPDFLERSTTETSKATTAFTLMDMPAEFSSVSFPALGRKHVSQLWTDNGYRSVGRQASGYEGKIAPAVPREFYRTLAFEAYLPNFKPELNFNGPDFHFAWNMVR
jgi:hypothetical protein